MKASLIKMAQMTEQKFEKFNISITAPLQPPD